MAEPREHDPADALAAMTAGGAAFPADAARGDDENEDDVLLAAPPPDTTALATGRATHELITGRQIRTRRTLIPILLTCGVLMPAVASLKWLRGAESPFAAWPLWPPVVLTGCGLILLALAVLNMLQVRHLMRASPRAPRHP